MHRVGVPDEHGGPGRGRIPAPQGPGRQPAVYRQQPRQDQDREDRVGHRVFGVEEPGRQQRGDHGHRVGGRAGQPEPPPGHVGQRHQARADQRVDQQDAAVGRHRVMGEPEDRRDQQRVAALVQRRVGEVRGRPARQDPRRDQVRGLVGIGQRHGLGAAEPGPQRHQHQPARPDQEPPAPGRPPCGGSPLGGLPVGGHPTGRHPSAGTSAPTPAAAPRRDRRVPQPRTY